MKKKIDNILINILFQIKNVEGKLKQYFKEIDVTVQNLGNSLLGSQNNDHEMIMALQTRNLKNQKLTNQLEQARKENKQLLSISFSKLQLAL